jgi:hypothetical protein
VKKCGTFVTVPTSGCNLVAGQTAHSGFSVLLIVVTINSYQRNVGNLYSDICPT